MFNTEKEIKLREDLLAIAKKLNSLGLNQGTSGNLSIRIDEGMLITPSSIDYENMNTEDLVKISLSGKSLSNNKHMPSSEWRLHADIFSNRLDIGAVVHCHSIYATALSCHSRGIPSFHYMVAVASGNDIRCAPYQTFGTKELSKATLVALKDRLSCLLAHHGQVSIGANIKQALKIAVEVETLAHMYMQACLLGEPEKLSELQMKEVHTQFKNLNYGK